ncbi:MAG TPA: amidase family protein, partial [Acidimicrobiales bacterium]
MDPFASALDIAAAIRAKELSPLEVADHYLERIEQLEPQLNAFAHRDPERVRRAASAATDAVAGAGDLEELPPFHGVPMPIKDLNP